MDFLGIWTERFGLKLPDWRTAAMDRLRSLPFSDPEETFSLLTFLFDELPSLLSREEDEEARLLADAYGWCCFSFWQCGSAFPAFPENYAIHLRDVLKVAPRDRLPSTLLLAQLIAGEGESDGRCGFNKLVLPDPEVIRESEARIHEGRYEVYLKAEEKYEEYVTYLEELPTFRAEWKAIKSTFAKECQEGGIVRRTLITERNWVQGPGAKFGSVGDTFQAIFDFFCWKYFLWGMDGDKPLLMKTSVVFTPFGTQLFIPGYLSLDLKRDLDLTKIMRLHRARGISRQGSAFSTGRKETIELRKQAQAADLKARKAGLKGDARYEFIRRAIGLHDSGDYRRIRKLLKAPQKSPILR